MARGNVLATFVVRAIGHAACHLGLASRAAEQLGTYRESSETKTDNVADAADPLQLSGQCAAGESHGVNPSGRPSGEAAMPRDFAAGLGLLLCPGPQSPSQRHGESVHERSTTHRWLAAD